MKKEELTLKVTINEEAFNQLEKIVAAENTEAKDLRIYSAGSG
jgi:Fe-S cluster assembly iron-binding protein IscA